MHLRFGYKLIGEKEKNIKETIGIVEKIDKKYFSPLYKLDSGNSKIAIIIISSIEYYIMSINGININDNVKISYLEKSGYILEITIL